MSNFVKKYMWDDIGDDARRQYIDSRAAFTAWEDVCKARLEVRGRLKWRELNGTEYLLKVSPTGSQKSLGPRSIATEEIYNKFTARRQEVDQRIIDLSRVLVRHQRMNRALFVGRAPRLLVNILNRLEKEGLAEFFTVIGTHALYAYEAAAGVAFSQSEAMETRDIDLMFDVRKRLSFVTQMERLEMTMLKVLQKEDSTFRIRSAQLHTAVNSSGFEVDIIRRDKKDDDPHPLRLTEDDNELFAVPAKNAEMLLDGPQFSAMIVATTGHMARMNTISPVTFAKFKRWLNEQQGRDAMKRRRDLLQAELVEELIEEYFPQLSASIHD